MEPRKDRVPTWLALLALAVALPPAAIWLLWQYMAATATPLHKDPRTVPSATRSAPSPEWTRAVEQARQIARADLSEKNLPGMSVAVGARGDLVWAEGFGWADLKDRAVVTPATRFRIGTASVALTSAAAGLLIEKQRLKLDEKVQTYVPGFPEKEWPVTLAQLMGHVAGVRTDGGDEGPLFSEHCARPVEALRFFAEDPLRFEPGTRFQFLSYGWILVSAAVEAAAQEPYAAFMRKRIFEPLEMNDTTVDEATADSAPPAAPDRATSYFPRFAGDPRYGPDPMRPLDYSCYAGSSVFLSTPSDLVRFAMAINRGKLLQPDTVRLLQASQRLASGEETGYGLGWDLETVSLSGRQTSVVGHDGDVLGGMAVSLMTIPEHGIVVSVTANTSYADTFSLAVKIAQAFTPAPAPR
ncbi:MAG TPA: serine hydrolase domain-containing protein [Vicinamibacteria bacterium]|nr:serine hydrolase domain-containing protein [Vicinamibacteria bacterium]